MNFICTKCGSMIPDEHVSVKDSMAQCPRCSSIFSLSELQRNAGVHVDQYAERPTVPLPKGIKKNMDYDGLVITRRWFSWAVFFLIPFSIVWLGGVSLFIFAGLTSGDLIFALFPLIHLSVGIGLFYYAMALMFNKTTLSIKNDELRIKHGPIPWKGPKPISRTEAKQFYCKERISRNRNGTQVHYALHLQTSDGKDLKLITGLGDASQALYLEQEIERHWGISNERVGGEMPS
jgi:hypothetical protein